MPERDITPRDKKIGNIFLVWFFANFVGIMIVSRISIWLTLALFGEIFLVIGALAVLDGVKKRNLNPVFLIIPFIGLLMMVSGIVMKFAGGIFKAVIPFLLVGIFFVTGILCILNYYRRKRMEEQCTVWVQGNCVDIRRKFSNTGSVNSGGNGRVVYCPVFAYSFQGQRYEVCTEVYTSYVNAQVGQTYNLYINPQYPQQFREQGENMRQNKADFIGGVICLATSVIAYIAMIAS